MNKIFLFLLFSTCTVLLSVVIITIGPITNKLLNSEEWGYQNCQLLDDKIKLFKGDLTRIEYMKNLCYRQKAMHDMEYTSFIINIILGFVCADLALIHYAGYGKDFEIKTGVIGFIAGIIGFILALVYACYSGYIFTKDIAFINLNTDNLEIEEDNAIQNLYSNGALYYWQEYVDGTAEYLAVDDDKERDFINYIRYKDLRKNIYNYNSNYYKSFYNFTDKDENENLCVYDLDNFKKGIQIIDKNNKKCQYLYYTPKTTIENKYIYDRWLATLILACLVIACDLCLAFFGFLLFTNFGQNLI